jgi:monofunctional biosynthetic peptidoglycan transglycosylase
MKSLLRGLGLWVLWVLVAGLALQLFFLGRIAWMVVWDPQSTTFQRSEAWRIATERDRLRWAQQWVAYPQLSDHLKRAVIASEDATFATHGGVDWKAIESAWQKNAKRQAQAMRAQAVQATSPHAARRPRIIGGSTITQQLAKNLFLSGERHLLRKGQELVLTLMLEALLSKERILEIYLNSVEWGEGVFGAEAAARHYFKKSARQLSAHEAARLAVMLPAPKRYEKRPASGYLQQRSQTIVARMSAVQLP